MRTKAQTLFLLLSVVCMAVTGIAVVGFLGTVFDLWDKEVVPTIFTLPVTAAILAVIALGSAIMGVKALDRSGPD